MHQNYSKIIRIPNLRLFFTSTRGVNNFGIFHLIKVTKYIQDRCGHLGAEIGSWFYHVGLQCFLVFKGRPSASKANFKTKVLYYQARVK
jgi:hypothetical protein